MSDRPHITYTPVSKAEQRGKTLRDFSGYVGDRLWLKRPCNTLCKRQTVLFFFGDKVQFFSSVRQKRRLPSVKLLKCRRDRASVSSVEYTPTKRQRNSIIFYRTSPKRIVFFSFTGFYCPYTDSFVLFVSVDNVDSLPYAFTVEIPTGFHFGVLRSIRKFFFPRIVCPSYLFIFVLEHINYNVCINTVR